MQEDLDRRFGNEKTKKRKPQPNGLTLRPAVAGVPGSEMTAEKPPKKLTYVEYKKYKTGALATLDAAEQLKFVFIPLYGH